MTTQPVMVPVDLDELRKSWIAKQDEFDRFRLLAVRQFERLGWALLDSAQAHNWVSAFDEFVECVNKELAPEFRLPVRKVAQ